MKKAQAGLEYVVVYGWLLVLVVTIGTVLFFVFSPNSTKFICSTDQQEKFTLAGYNVPEKYHYLTPGDYWYDSDSVTEPIEISLKNASGENIKITGVECWVKGKYAPCASDGKGSGYFSNLNGTAKINGTKFTEISSGKISVASDGKIQIQNFAIINRPADGFAPPGKFRISYLDAAGQEKKFAVSCDGYPNG